VRSPLRLGEKSCAAQSIVADLRRVLGRRCEDELARGGLAPVPDPALKRPELTIGEDAREFTLEALEEFSADSIGLSLEPCADTGPDVGERVRACQPISPRSGCAPMSGADLAVLPRRRQAGKKAVQAALVTRRQMRRLARREAHQVVLHHADLFQEA
jgi:hypothetical protein